MTEHQVSINDEPARVLSEICSDVEAEDGIFIFYCPSRDTFFAESDQVVGEVIGELSRFVHQLRTEETPDLSVRALDRSGEDTSFVWSESEEPGRVRCFPLRITSNLIGVLAVGLENKEELAPEIRKKVFDTLEDRYFCFARARIFYSSEYLFDHPFLMGDTKEWRKVNEHLMAAAGSGHEEYPVYIQGEPGTGKAFAAHLIHFMSGRSREGMMVPVNCSTMKGSPAGMELFGHERGALTDAHEDRKAAFERASNGTLFLDEVEGLSRDDQKRLLRAVKHGKINRAGEVPSCHCS